MIEIRPATESDFEQIWLIFSEVVSRGDTYAFSPNTSKSEAYTIWMKVPQITYVAVNVDEILGTYYLKPNQPGLGSHVCNAGFMVAASARGQGIGRLMGEHSLKTARDLGFKAIQFNFVVSTNLRAIQLWQNLGFNIVGTLPNAFLHQELGFVDVYVMYQELGVRTQNSGVRININN